jgi:hypothetical protein
MQIDGVSGPGSGSRSGAAAGSGQSFLNGSIGQLPFPAATQLPFPGSQQHQQQQGRQAWPAALFSSSLGQPPGSSSRDAPPHQRQQQQQQSQLSFSSFSAGDAAGPSGAAAAAAAAVGGEPRTPVGSPLKGAGSSRSGAAAAAAAGGLGSPSWFSPKSRVRYSDRFIPSRAATARLDFSALDREVVADQVNKSAQEREVRREIGQARSSLAVHVCLT